MLSLRKPWRREEEGAEHLDVGCESSPWLWLQRGQSVGLNRGQGCYGQRAGADRPRAAKPQPHPSHMHTIPVCHNGSEQVFAAPT